MMNLMKPVWCSVLFFLATGAALAAGLQWDATTLQRDAKLGEDTVLLSFGFSNPEDRAITVTHLNPSCGCTTASLEKKTYARGEKGTIDVLFDARNRTGVQEKTVQVFTDAGQQPVILTFRVTIPAWLEIAPSQLAWVVGEESNAKEAVVTVQPGVKLRSDSLKVDGSGMEASITPEADGRRYRLTVKPVSTKSQTQATILLGAAIEGAAERRFMLFAQVR